VSAQDVALHGASGAEGEACLVANLERGGFRATLAKGEFLDDQLQLIGSAIARLGLAAGATACAVRMD